MGYGTMLKVGLNDPRSDYQNVKLKVVPDSVNTHYMNAFSIQDASTINNKTDSGNRYCEFEAGEDGSASISFNLDMDDETLATLTFQIKQVYHFWSSNDYETTITFSCASNQYALLVMNNGNPYLFLPDQTGKNQLKGYPSNQTISGPPGHWESGNDYPNGWLEFQVLYVGIANFPVNRLSSLCAHNAFTSPQTGYIYYQQNIDVANQLTYGVRSLMLDTYWYNDQIVLAHGEPGTAKYAIQKILPWSGPDSLSETFDNIKKFLSENKEEYVFIFFEDYVKDKTKWGNFLASYSSFIYGYSENGISYPQFSVSSGSPDTGARISDIKGKMVLFVDSRNSSFIPYTWDYCIETVYGNASLDSDLNVAMAQRGESAGITNFNNYQNRAFLLVNNFPDFDIALAIRNYGLEAGLISVLLGFAMPALFAVACLAFVAAAAAAIAWKVEVQKRNNGTKLINKAKWARQIPANQEDINHGHYGKLPHFIAVDFVTEGNAIAGVGYSAASMINDWIADQSSIYPNEIPLGIFGLNNKAVTASYFYDDSTPKTSLTISNNDIQLVVPTDNRSCTVQLDYGTQLQRKNVLSLTPMPSDDGKNIFWQVSFTRYFIATAIYQANTSRAFILNTSNQQQYALNLISIDGQTFAEVSLDQNIGEDDVCQVYLAGIEDPDLVLCATFSGSLNNFSILPNVNSAPPTYADLRCYEIRKDHPLLQQLISRHKRKRPALAQDTNALFLPFPSPNFSVARIDPEGNPVYHPISLSIAETSDVVDFDYFACEFAADHLDDDKTYTIRITNTVDQRSADFVTFSLSTVDGNRQFDFIQYKLSGNPFS